MGFITNKDDGKKRIGFFFEEHQDDPLGFMYVAAYLPENIRIVLNVKRDVPMVEILIGDEGLKEVVITVSRPVYNSSGCLHKAKTRPGK